MSFWAVFASHNLYIALVTFRDKELLEIINTHGPATPMTIEQFKAKTALALKIERLCRSMLALSSVCVILNCLCSFAMTETYYKFHSWKGHVLNCPDLDKFYSGRRQNVTFMFETPSNARFFWAAFSTRQR